MRKIVASLFISLDGVVEAPETWQGPFFDDRMGEVTGSRFTEAGALLLGRKTYEIFAGHWPNETEDALAGVLNSVPKLVLSTTLTSVDWAGSTLLNEDAAAKLAEEKARDGGDILVSGSVSVVRWLLAEGLLDELELLVHPTVLGKGERLFDDTQVNFEVVESEQFPGGAVRIIYRPVVR
ncbi:dihydrofolate reductase family protein [Amycolatopsis sp. 195334CR]|uniref:dihydrofolate reductase family protein n=1 Tax=Amycolatopsis sp. 195334CR TaxID=2814588 RepID=UPI001A8F59B6|nr:dihydrofolate reductase family protein [Amycolatopsis sp. 195334CR]MBN6034701.1 dihydrofolate reductase family protein [Amycolatopsis sp. 195334CR]